MQRAFKAVLSFCFCAAAFAPGFVAAEPLQPPSATAASSAHDAKLGRAVVDHDRASGAIGPPKTKAAPLTETECTKASGHVILEDKCNLGKACIIIDPENNEPHEICIDNAKD